MAQPPLSQQIKRCESELGFELFERTPKGVVLTRAGESLLKHARAILESVKVATKEAAAAYEGEGGRLTVAFINSAALSTVPKLLRAFRTSHPGVEVDVREMTISDQLDALVDGRVDVGVLRPPVDDSRLTSMCLSEEAFVAALPTGHILANRQRIHLRDLKNERLITYPRGHWAGFRERVEAEFRVAAVTPLVVHESTQVHTICGLVAGGVGAALVPSSATALVIEGLIFKPLEASKLSAATWLAWSADAHARQTKNFVEVARGFASRAAEAPGSQDSVDGGDV